MIVCFGDWVFSADTGGIQADTKSQSYDGSALDAEVGPVISVYTN
jgi:hypothetical protein